MSESEKKVEAPTRTNEFAPAVIALSKVDKSGAKNVRVFDQFVEYGSATLADVSSDFPEPDYWVEVSVQGADAKDVRTFAAPRYSDTKLQVLQDALSADMAGNARNASKAENPEYSWSWEDYFSKKDAGSYAKVLSEWKRLLAEWLSEATEYTPEQSALIISKMDTRKISDMPQANKDKLRAIVDAFVEALEDPDAVRSATTSIVNALSRDTDDLGFI